MNLLGRARKMFQGLGPAEPAQPQYYRVACSEGHPLQGERRESYQAIRCPACGDGIFVLPRSPLPTPPAPAERSKKHAPDPHSVVVDEGPIALADPPVQPSAAEGEIVWDEPNSSGADVDIDIPYDEPPEERPASEPAKREPKPRQPASAAADAADAQAAPTKPRVRRRAAAPNAPASQVAASHPVPPAPSHPREPLSQRIKRHRVPLVIVGVLLLVAGTFGIRMLREWRQNLPQIAEKNTEEGLIALENADFDLAKTKLARAARAREQLGDEEAYKTRQAADEAAILADLASASLEEMVEDIATREDGQSKFETLYKGRSVLLEGEVASLTGKDKGNFQLDYFVLGGAGAKPKRGVVDLEGLEIFESPRPKPGEILTFGARLQAIGLREDGVWHIRLIPDSGVRIISPQAWKALEAIEFTSTGLPPEATR